LSHHFRPNLRGSTDKADAYECPLIEHGRDDALATSLTSKVKTSSVVLSQSKSRRDGQPIQGGAHRCPAILPSLPKPLALSGRKARCCFCKCRNSVGVKTSGTPTPVRTPCDWALPSNKPFPGKFVVRNPVSLGVFPTTIAVGRQRLRTGHALRSHFTGFRFKHRTSQSFVLSVMCQLLIARDLVRWQNY